MIFYLILLFALDVTLQHAKLWRALSYFNRLKQNLEILKHRKNTEDFEIQILIPVLWERGIISDVINYFSKILENSRINLGKISLVIIGSIKEINDPNGTLETAERYITNHKLKNINIVKCPILGSKATQLNYYINQNRGKHIWYFIFDVDSRPEKNFLRLFFSGKPLVKNIYQMPSNYLSNVSDHGNPVRNAFAMNQTIFSLNTEFYNSLECNPLKKFTSNSLMGHGLIINQYLLDKLGGFPDPVEDSRLANIATLRGIKVKMIPIFDYSSVPEHLSTLLMQYSGWFFGQIFIFKDMGVIFRKKYSLNIYLKFFHRVIVNLYWIFKTPFIVGVLSALVFTRQFNLLIIFMYIQILNHVKILYLNRLSPQNRLTTKHIFHSILWDFLYSLGPLLFFIRLLKKRISKNSSLELLPKTEKNKFNTN